MTTPMDQQPQVFCYPHRYETKVHEQLIAHLQHLKSAFIDSLKTLDSIRTVLQTIRNILKLHTTVANQAFEASLQIFLTVNVITLIKNCSLIRNSFICKHELKYNLLFNCLLKMFWCWILCIVGRILYSFLECETELPKSSIKTSVCWAFSQLIVMFSHYTAHRRRSDLFACLIRLV